MARQSNNRTTRSVRVGSSFSLADGDGNAAVGQYLASLGTSDALICMGSIRGGLCTEPSVGGASGPATAAPSSKFPFDARGPSMDLRAQRSIPSDAKLAARAPVAAVVGKQRVHARRATAAAAVCKKAPLPSALDATSLAASGHNASVC